MSEAAFDQVSESLLRGSLNTTATHTELLLQILEQMLMRANYTNEDMRGLKTILAHLNSGGNANMSSIDIKDAEAIGTILKGLNVPFVTMRDGSTDRCIIVTRDTERDRMLATEAFRRFAVEKGVDLQQISIDELLKANENRQVKHADRLTPAELEVFKERMKSYKGQYAVVRSAVKKGAYDVYYPNKCSREVENALKDMAYDLAGQEGRRYEESVNDFIARRDRFIEKLNVKDNGVMFAVSKSDPTHFISISGDEYSIHRANATRFTDRDGKEHISMTDKFPKRETDRRKMFESIQDYIPDVVILTQEEMGIVSTVSANGTCIFVPDAEFTKKYQELNAILQSKKPELPLSPAKKDFMEKPVLTSYMKLDRGQLDEVLSELKPNGLDTHLAISDDGVSFSIAFKEDDLQVKEKVDTVLFGGLSKLDSLNARLYNEGRAVDDFNKPGFVVFDAASYGAAIFMTEEGAVIAGVKDGKSEKLLTPDEKETMKRDNPEFGDTLAGMINGMKEPVIMKKEEYDLLKSEPEKFATILASRIPSQFDTPAEKEYYRHAEQKERAAYEELHKHDNTIDAKNLPERSQEALKHYKELEISELYVDRTFTEKITEMDFSDRKMIDRSFLEEITTTSVNR